MSSLPKTYTLGEEIFNSVSHGVAGLLAIAGTAVLIVFASIYSNAWGIVSACIYGSSFIILYLMSTIYHALAQNRAKRFFRIMDHNSIFIMIAGSYTPFTLVTLNGWLGWVLFGIVWGVSILGIVLNSIDLEKFKKPSVICYIALGWVIVPAIKPAYENLSAFALIMLLLGGIVYTAGVYFYAKKNVKWFHSIWHLFTIGGSVLQYFAIFDAIINIPGAA